MPTFAILIDDGEFIASEPSATYPNILMAIADTLRTAALIAVEREPVAGGEQRLTCEVQDRSTGEHREITVRFDVSSAAMVPIGRL